MSWTGRITPLVALLGFASLFAGASAENKITYPDKDGMTFYQGDSLTVRYVTDYASPELHLFCFEQGSDVIVDKLKQPIQTGTGSKTIAIDLDGVSTCWFNIQTNGNIWGVNSPLWTFQSSRPAQQTTTTTTSLSSPPATSTAAPSAAVTIITQIIFNQPSASPTLQPTVIVTPGTNNGNISGSSSNESSNNEGGLSTGVKAGIGAGVGVGAALAIAGLIYFILTRRKRRAQNHQSAAELPAGEATNYGAGGFGQPQQQQLYFPSAAAADKSHGIPVGAGGWSAAPPEAQGQQQSEPYELYTGPQGSELPATERAEGKRW
ncbi:cell wall integrity and stress response component [Microdochium nivale]|nr:cell wall integrity and stress response component [Microdochium nivale]